MFRKYPKWLCYVIILFLLPYVITVFLNGPSQKVNGDTVKVNLAVENDGEMIDMSIEDYCIGKLAKEIPADSEMEAIKAQAVLVRTAVYKQLKENGSEGVFADEFWTTGEMERQWGLGLYGKYYKRLQNAWNETQGQVLMYEDDLANAPYCKLTNGNTRDGQEVLGGEYPYLKIKECPLDIEALEQIQTVVIDEAEMEILSMDTAGYVTEMKVGTEKVKGEEFRNTYGLASSSFTIQKYDGKMRITTRGVGHGLGLSQHTANEMAKRGDDYRTILDYFFEGTRLQEIADVVMNIHFQSEQE